MWIIIAILAANSFGLTGTATAKHKPALSDAFWPFAYQEGAIPLDPAPPDLIGSCRRSWFAGFIPSDRKLAEQMVDQGGRVFIVGDIHDGARRRVVLMMPADESLIRNVGRHKDPMDNWQGLLDVFDVMPDGCQKVHLEWSFFVKLYDQKLSDIESWRRALTRDYVRRYLDNPKLGTIENALKMRAAALLPGNDFTPLLVEIDAWLMEHGWTPPSTAAP